MPKCIFIPGKNLLRKMINVVANSENIEQAKLKLLAY